MSLSKVSQLSKSSCEKT